MKLAFAVEYDGSGFKGWQSQPQQRTVQGCVDAAFSQLANHAVTSICAGRTDTGVHATGQVVHIETHAEREAHAWLFGCNAGLPAEISLQWMAQVPDSFNARHSAIARSYRYIILNRRLRSALLRNRCAWVCQDLDAERMHRAAQALLGEHDFSGFRSAACQAHTAIRCIKSITVWRAGEFVYIDIRANAFLHNMVRIISGVLISIGKGDQPESWAGVLLEARDRALSGKTAVPHGLYLVKVHYPQIYQLPDISIWPEY